MFFKVDIFFFSGLDLFFLQKVILVDGGDTNPVTFRIDIFYLKILFEVLVSSASVCFKERWSLT